MVGIEVVGLGGMNVPVSTALIALTPHSSNGAENQAFIVGNIEWRDSKR